MKVDTQKPLNLEGLIWSLGSVVTLGFSGFFDKLGSNRLSNPLWYSLITLLSALFIAFFYMKFVNKISIKKIVHSRTVRINLWVLVLLGVTSSGVVILFRFYGLKSSTATFVALSQITTSLLTVFFAFLVFREYLPSKFTFLFPIVLLATYFFSTGTIHFSPMKQGDMLIFIAAVIHAMGNMFGKIASKHFDASVISAGRIFWGLVFVALSIFVTNTHLITFSHVLIFPIISGAIMAINFICYYEGVKRCGVGLTTSLLIFSPLLTKVLSFFFLSEKINTIQTISFGVILLFGYTIIHSAFYKKNINH